MANDKKTIVVYSDWIELFSHLSDEEAGRLIKHFFNYVNDLNPVAPDRITELSFIPIKQSLKRDLKKWEGIKIKRSEAGKKSAELRKQNSTNPTNSTSVESVEQNSTNPTVSVSVSVNDSVINNIDMRKSRFADTLKPFLPKYGKDFLNDFYSYWTEPNISNTKFKKELQKTWSLERRLETWAKNENKFSPKKQETTKKSLGI